MQGLFSANARSNQLGRWPEDWLFLLALYLPESTLLAPGRSDARPRLDAHGCSPFLYLTLLLGNYAPISRLYLDACAPSAFCPQPLRLRQPLPPSPSASCARYRATIHPFTPPRTCTAPKQLQRAQEGEGDGGPRVWQGGSHCNICNIRSTFETFK
jgi:hypothetical protein